jgi:hypothetical protein
VIYTHVLKVADNATRTRWISWRVMSAPGPQADFAHAGGNQRDGQVARLSNETAVAAMMGAKNAPRRQADHDDPGLQSR